MRAAIGDLVGRRLMLCEDADDAQTRLVAAGLAAGVPQPRRGESFTPNERLPHCLRSGR